MANSKQNGNGTFQIAEGWSTERWTAVVVIGALLLLMAIRAGFRGVNVMGFRASVS